MTIGRSISIKTALVTLSNVLLTASGTGISGGISLIAFDSARLTGVTVQRAQSGSSGGCIAVESRTAVLVNLTLQNCTSAADGGGLFVEAQQRITIVEAWVSHAYAVQRGGALALVAVTGLQMLLENVTLLSNSALQGGGLFVAPSMGSSRRKAVIDCRLVVESIALHNNSAIAEGGGAYIWGGATSSVKGSSSIFEAFWLSAIEQV